MEQKKVFAVYWQEADGTESIVDFSGSEGGSMYIFPDKESADLKIKEIEDDMNDTAYHENRIEDGKAIVREMTLS